MINKKSLQNDGYAYNDEDMTIMLQLESGIVECDIDVILTANEQDYIVLRPLDDFGDERGEIWYYRYFDDEDDAEDDPTIKAIETDEELQLIMNTYQVFLKRCEDEESCKDLADVEPSITDEDLDMKHSAGKLLNDMEELDDPDLG